MNLRVVGAGLPRTGTASLGVALERLLGGRCYHMSVIPGHPFGLGAGWDLALAGGAPDWDLLFEGYAAALDWPASSFWRELSDAYPEALVLLSVRDTAETWWHSADETFLPVARLALAPNWDAGRGLLALLERFAGSERWNDPATRKAISRWRRRSPSSSYRLCRRRFVRRNQRPCSSLLWSSSASTRNWRRFWRGHTG